MSATKLSVKVGKHFACIIVNGEGNRFASPAIEKVIDGLIEKNFRHFIVDLTDCGWVDSSFVGTLATYGVKLNPKNIPDAAGLQLHNVCPAVQDPVERNGTPHMFKLTHGVLHLPGEVKTCDMEFTCPTREEVLRTSLKAHQTLIAINPDNDERFKDVVLLLAEELRKLENPE